MDYYDPIYGSDDGSGGDVASGVGGYEDPIYGSDDGSGGDVASGVGGYEDPIYGYDPTPPVTGGTPTNPYESPPGWVPLPVTRPGGRSGTPVHDPNPYLPGGPGSGSGVGRVVAPGRGGPPVTQPGRGTPPVTRPGGTQPAPRPGGGTPRPGGGAARPTGACASWGAGLGLPECVSAAFCEDYGGPASTLSQLQDWGRANRIWNEQTGVWTCPTANRPRPGGSVSRPVAGACGVGQVSLLGQCLDQRTALGLGGLFLLLLLRRK